MQQTLAINKRCNRSQDRTEHALVNRRPETTRQDESGAGSQTYESILWNSETIAIAHLGGDWRIIDANSAFRMVTGVDHPEKLSIVDLISADDAAGWPQQTGRMYVEAVLLNYIRGDSDVTSLRSRLYSMPDFVTLVAEIPVHDLMAAEGVMKTLNDEITTLARESTRKSHLLKRKSEELKVALHDLDTSYWHLKKIQEVLPICMYCHKVKSAANQWEDVADYLKKNSLFLSHGMCPTCAPLYGKS